MKFNVIGVGEVLWDLLPNGPQLGGAPANFAYHAHALGASSRVISRIGDDDRGREIVNRLRGMNTSTEGLQIDANSPTGTVSVEIQADGVPHFVIHEDVAWDHLAVTAEDLAAASRADAICFGTLAQRTHGARHAVQTLVSTTPKSALRVLDINLRQHYYSREVIEESLRLSNVLKLNQDELATLVNIFGLTESARGNPACEEIATIAQRFDQKIIALTRGSNGSLLYHDGRWSDSRHLDRRDAPLQIIDTVGAGDAFTAALVLGLLNKIDLDQTNRLADEVAAYVCSHPGATPPLSGEFARRFRARPHD